MASWATSAKVEENHGKLRGEHGKIYRNLHLKDGKLTMKEWDFTNNDGGNGGRYNGKSTNEMGISIGKSLNLSLGDLRASHV